MELVDNRTYVFSRVPRLTVLALLECCGCVEIENTENMLTDERRECKRITHFIQRLIQTRREWMQILAGARFSESHREKFIYTKLYHKRFVGAHVIDHEGNHHILCDKGRAVPELPQTTGEQWILVVYQNTDGEDDVSIQRYAKASSELAKWYAYYNRPDDLIRLTKHGALDNDILCLKLVDKV